MIYEYNIPQTMRDKVVKRVFELTADEKYEVRGFASVAVGNLKYLIPRTMRSRVVKKLLRSCERNPCYEHLISVY